MHTCPCTHTQTYVSLRMFAYMCVFRSFNRMQVGVPHASALHSTLTQKLG